MNRFFLGRFFRLISKSWQMYPLGVLFGLGFDTATEVGLLALAAGRREPRRAVPRRALPADPVRGRHVADGHGRRRVHEPGLRLGVLEPDAEGLLQHHGHLALGARSRCAVGSIELLQVFAARFGLDSGFWGWLNALDFEKLGYGIVGLFVVTWAGSVVIWKARRIDERWGRALQRSSR